MTNVSNCVSSRNNPGNTANLNTAKTLAACGLPIFPAIATWNKQDRKYEKKPAISGWRAAATIDIGPIENWWRQFPNAIPAVELGQAGLVVIDLDRHPGSPDGVTAFRQLWGSRPPAWAPIAVTASKGLHLYFSQGGGEPFTNARGKLPLGVDIRGIGGWVVAPGAVIADGKWTSMSGRPSLGAAYRAQKIPPVPDWLRAVIQPPKPTPEAPWTYTRASSSREAAYASKAMDLQEEALSTALPGLRNHTLNAAAFRMGRMAAREWIGVTEITERLIRAACASGLPAHEIRRTLGSGLKAGLAKPLPDLQDRPR